nr:golgi apyrase [Quercus suber]
MGKHSYGVILDAGSSGSRIYVYRWKKAQAARTKGDAEDLASLPEIKSNKDWHKKVKPGISTFGERPKDVGAAHLKELVEFAQEIVPKDEMENTPIFLLATAGMRLLPEYQRTAILENVCAYFQKETKFLLPDCGLHVQVIPGETEGLYGWIAANSLLGGFDAPDQHSPANKHHTYGFLDMGGASAQIAFAPNATETEKHADDLTLLRLRTVNGVAKEYRVFVTTWLGFGANEARRRYVDALLKSSNGQVMRDPCLPTGLQVDQTGLAVKAGSKEPYLVGTGNFTACLTRTFPLLEKEKLCVNKPCLLNGIHTPAIDFDVNHFVGVSEYWHTTHEVFAMAHKDKAYDFHTYQTQVTEFCSRDWNDIQKDVADQKWGKKVDEKTVEEVCFKASWLINVLHDGIGIPRVGLEPIKQPGTGWSNKTTAVIDKAKDRGFLDPFQAVDKIKGTEVSWTLGKMVLYASSQMPPAENSLAVGFGSNVQGTDLPADFQFAGGSSTSLTTDIPKKLEDNHDEDWHDRILNSHYSRRAPGILILLIILTVAIYLLCGRDRRHIISHKILSLLGRKPGPHSSLRTRRRKAPGFLSSNLFRGHGAEQAYERVLESADPNDFELSDVSPTEGRNSDSSLDPSTTTTNISRTGRTSGWATPATRGLSPDFSRNSTKTKGYFDSPDGGGGSGLGITPFERGGLVVRTESKERLFAPKSRASSPSRKGSLMTPSLLKESVD